MQSQRHGHRYVALLSLVAVATLPLVGTAQQRGSAPPALAADTRKVLVEALAHGAAYIMAQQNVDGSFDANPGVTGIAAAALLRQTGKDRAGQAKALGKTLDYLASMAKPDGGIYVQQIPHYITAVSVSALAAAGRPQDKRIIERGRQYLVESMLDEGEGVKADDKWYGGMSYGGANQQRRADIISLETGLQALKDAELPANDAAWKKAIAFLQRTQNNSETNDQKEAINDGGFVYLPGFTYNTDGGMKSYGSASYAGVLSYSWANIPKNDERVQAVFKWIRDNYTVDENPGMGQKTVYYYYMVFAKALKAYGDPVIVDSLGRRHVWREDLGRKLISLQNPQGYWVNTADKAELQDNKVLVTAFTMMAIEAILE
jgi:squalene-hopene/tetraprenyl-beta-curcumene cyclase